MIPIHVVGGRGLIYDIEDLKTLREKHHICGTLTGILPQIPQQNVFMGLPLELMAEDVAYLLKAGVAYLVDDKVAHETAVLSHTEKDYEAIEQRKAEKYKKDLEQYKQQAWDRRVAALQAKAKKKGIEYVPDDEETKQKIMDSYKMDPNHETEATSNQLAGYKLFQSESRTDKVDHPTVAAFEMYHYLHDRGYFMSPGLRFGGQFLAYPGDPVRYHSHFTATGFDYDQEFKILDIVSSGRLGTAVKKCWLVGARDQEKPDEEYQAYSIEWAGFG